ncbi:DUF4145 domain-containing protein [Svornostia abyssi]|uniref:DUF4145 domain-containing protein n=1 Tax=Svornostia abyssi TaxID=2898438 RepID=A0ABY5PBC3_9ACTN|nr:DUF4145 domain-containing protein [Parviterribacteraceae bacterium J379]
MLPFPFSGDDPPPKDPDSLPTSHDPSGPCTRCGRVSNFDVAGSAAVTFDGLYSEGLSGRERSYTEQVSILACHGCGHCMVVVEEQWVGDQPVRDGVVRSGTVSWQGIHWWPAVGASDIGPEVPDAVREAYAEGVRANAANAPRAAVVMFRRTLEAIVDDSGSDAAKRAAKSNLASALRVMADEGALYSQLADWATEVRQVGNAGAHFDPLEPLDSDDAKELGKLLRELLKFLYELPAQLAKRRAAPG